MISLQTCLRVLSGTGAAALTKLLMCHPLLFDLNFSTDQSENESVENERNILN